MKRTGRSRTTLFLIELTVAVGVFSLCTAVCLSLFASAKRMTAESTALNGASLSAQSAAECFKAESGDPARCAAVLGAEMTENGASLRVYYDEQWRATGAAGASYVLTLSVQPVSDAAESPVRKAAISVTACGEARPLMEITASCYAEEAAR